MAIFRSEEFIEIYTSDDVSELIWSEVAAHAPILAPCLRTLSFTGSLRNPVRGRRPTVLRPAWPDIVTFIHPGSGSGRMSAAAAALADTIIHVVFYGTDGIVDTIHDQSVGDASAVAEILHDALDSYRPGPKSVVMTPPMHVDTCRRWADPAGIRVVASAGLVPPSGRRAVGVLCDADAIAISVGDVVVADDSVRPEIHDVFIHLDRAVALVF